MTEVDLVEALRWLDGRVNLEAEAHISRIPRSPASLDRMTELMGLLSDPQHAYPVLHLTGTNGKTSTARILTRLLEVAGLSVGTYTSPHLESVTERMSWNGEPIADDAFAAAVGVIAALSQYMEEPPSYFEAVTAAAFRWFAEVAVHAAVVEVGLLGRWDATNVADGQIAVVTNVGPDHLDYAGTLEGVAREKAGIVKAGSILVLGETNPELVGLFTDTPAEVWLRGRHFAVLDNIVAHGGRMLALRTPEAAYDQLYLGLHGAFQAENAAIALAAAEAFLGRPLEEGLVKEAFVTVRAPGRLEVVGRSPLCLLDGAHNPGGASALGAAIEEEFAEPQGWTVVLGMLRPHDVADFLRSLDLDGPRRVMACAPNSPRAVAPSEIAGVAAELGFDVQVAGPVAEAVSRALALSSGTDGVLVTGSLYTVGEARAALRRGVG